MIRSATPILTALALLMTARVASADAQLSSRPTTYATKYARIYQSDATKNAGTSITNWANVLR